MVANKKLTLAFLRQSSQILLGYKKKGFGAGRWNGFGGKVEPGETIEAAARREVIEECGLTSNSLNECGILMFEFEGDPQLLEVHVFQTDKFSGDLIESDEMRPKWFENKETPFSQMWPDDHLWFPYLLNKQAFYGYFTFRGMDVIVDYTLEAVDNISSVTIPSGPKS